MAPNEINESTGLNLTPHVIRDRLQDLVKEGKITSKGIARGTKYKIVKSHSAAIRMMLPTPEIKARGEVSFPLSKPAEKVREYVTAPLLNRASIGYKRSFLDEYRPNTSSYLTEEDKEILLGIGQVEAQTQPAGTYARKILNRLLIDLSFNSSRLEGNTYSLLDTERLIKDGAPAAGKNPQETHMILNHKDAIEYLVEPSDQVGLNRFAITNLHAHLAENLLGNPAAEGRLRTVPVDIGRSAYIPTAVPQLIEECFNLILAKTQQIQNPYEQAFFLLVHIPYLQPFEDVNKRVSRLTANIPLFRQNLCPLSFTDVPRRLYIEGLLGVYELNDLALFKEVFLWAYRRSVSRYKVIQESLGAPNPVNLRHRDLIKQIVSELVKVRASKETTTDKIARLLDTNLEIDDRNEVINAIERVLVSLHEGNIARFKLTLSEFQQWKANW
ncbi:MAG: Fic family protein [Gammaproteobacteria bacterium]|nr:MAG: Fic family protein [Gammaproteobacteria bacterium]